MENGPSLIWALPFTARSLGSSLHGTLPGLFPSRHAPSPPSLLRQGIMYPRLTSNQYVVSSLSSLMEYARLGETAATRQLSRPSLHSFLFWTLCPYNLKVCNIQMLWNINLRCVTFIYAVKYLMMQRYVLWCIYLTLYSCVTVSAYGLIKSWMAKSDRQDFQAERTNRRRTRNKKRRRRGGHQEPPIHSASHRVGREERHIE